MASTSAAKSLVETDCTQHNPLVDLSRRVIEGNLDDDFDFESTWNQFLTENSRPRDLHDEYLLRITKSTAAPKTTNLYELADQMDPTQNLVEMWAEEYIAGHRQSKNLVEQWADEVEQQAYLPEQWAEEFSSSNFYEQAAEDESKIKYVTNTDVRDKSEMWATEFLDEFDQKLQMNEGFALEDAVSASAIESNAETFARRALRDETYVFGKNNPYLKEANAFKKGLQALDTGMIVDAILYFEAAVQQNQKNFEGWFLLGRCLTENENDRQAIAAYKQALNLRPEHKEIQLALATVYINECMELEALKILKQWIISYLDSDSIPLQFKAIPSNIIEDLTIRTQQVEELIQKALSNAEKTDEGTFHNALSLVYNIKGDYNRAAQEVELALMYNPKDYVLWNRLGATLANGKRAAEAVAAYREALEICPNYTRARCNLGIACIQLQNYKEAIEHFITALQLQRSYNSVLSSTIWTPLRAAVVRSCLPSALDLLAAFFPNFYTMILRLFFFVPFVIILCNSLMRDKSVIPLFGNSRNKPFYPTSASLYGENINVVVEWDTVTPSPYKVVSTVIHTPNKGHEVVGKVISTVKESDILYNRGSSGKDKLYMRGIVEEPEGSDGTSSSEHDKINNGFEKVTLKDKAPVENNTIRHNSSECHFPSPNSTVTVTLESTTSASGTENNTLKKIQNELDHGKFMSDLRIIDIVEIFNTLATFVAATLSSELANTAHHSSLSDNSTFRRTKDEFFDEVDAQSISHFAGKALDRTFSQMHGNEDEVEINHINEMEKHSNDKHSGDNMNIDDYAVVRDEENHENFAKNSKLNPQVIPRSELVKSDISDQENRIINDCDINHIDTLTEEEDSEKQRLSNCATDEAKLWETRDEMDEKYKEKDERDSKSPILRHFDRTLWEKLVAGLKCSQRDCAEALKPTESVRRYLIEPSISRARKRSNRQL
uniref:Peroxin-5 n=1 Tax=Elaeophora elaphi TaxID=1147741 RepID=A0A0R3RJE6_9BILA